MGVVDIRKSRTLRHSTPWVRHLLAAGFYLLEALYHAGLKDPSVDPLGSVW